MSVLIFFLISYVLLSISLYFIFEKAGEQGWKGLVPGLNFVVWCKLIGRSPLHAAWLLFPIVNIFIYAGMSIDMVRSFNKFQFWHSVLAVILTPITFLYLGLNKEEKYDGPVREKEKAFNEELEAAVSANNTRLASKLRSNNPYGKSQTREWAEAVIFAVFAAAFIRMFLIEAYVIPTSSMEGSLLVGDFLFVSKANYGIRTPKTIMMVPLLHNRIPYLDGESYLEKPSLDFYRLPAIESIDRYDPVVFNYPEGDSVYVFKERTWSVHDYNRGAIPERFATQIRTGRKELVTRPVDKKDHYIKRCVGLPGDSLQIVDRKLIINGQPVDDPTHVQFTYLVQPPGRAINVRNFSDWGITESEDIRNRDNNTGSMLAILSKEQVEKIKGMENGMLVEPTKNYVVRLQDPSYRQQLSNYKVDNANFLGQTSATDVILALTNDQAKQLRLDSNLTVKNYIGNQFHLFPHDPKNTGGWTVDDYGPVYIPKKGTTTPINSKNIAFYRRVIRDYEGNELEEKGDQILINGEPATTYTFKMDYYWMMGDNRHNSEDSRVWGFVPHDHIVGKPLFIWLSFKENSIRKGLNWRRIFTSADKK